MGDPSPSSDPKRKQPLDVVLGARIRAKGYLPVADGDTALEG